MDVNMIADLSVLKAEGSWNSFKTTYETDSRKCLNGESGFSSLPTDSSCKASWDGSWVDEVSKGLVAKPMWPILLVALVIALLVKP